jgi:putative transposase
MRRRRVRLVRPKRLQAAYPGHIWAYDFVEDALADGTALRILTVMDEFTREGLAIDGALTTSADRVIGVLTALVAQHGAPAYLRSDNGAEFVAMAVQAWLAQCGVQTLYIEPGKPWQNGKEERFTGTVRDECLNLYLFGSMAEACVRLSTFRNQYNTERPHSQLGYLTRWRSRWPGMKPWQNSRILTFEFDSFRALAQRSCNSPIAHIRCLIVLEKNKPLHGSCARAVFGSHVNHVGVPRSVSVSFPKQPGTNVAQKQDHRNNVEEFEPQIQHSILLLSFAAGRRTRVRPPELSVREVSAVVC